MNRIKISILIILLFGLSNSLYSADTPAIQAVTANPVVLEQPETVITERALIYLTGQKTEKVKIWVFFTDKGIYSKSDFDRASLYIDLNEHAIIRRAKAGIDEIVFDDLPVRQEYVDIIKELGGDHRRSSKWLNAASFEISADLIDEIAALDFVYNIRPLGRYKRISMPEDGPESIFPGFEKLPADVLNYGPSYDQISQINVHLMHESGYNGQGVIVGMFDTGFRKSHINFVDIINEGRLLAEYDFINNDDNVQNESGDVSSQHDHGTKTWSALGGFTQGQLIGPAYGASFLLAKTEDMTGEYTGEEDNWQAAMEWADSLGVDVISSSLGYYEWYDYSDMDGQTATITIAANIATSLGILVCNAMGNRGYLGSGSLDAPADAFDILSCGAVDGSGIIASFSALGPTFDGRTKPEVCARGVTCRIAKGTGDLIFTTGSGTSFSTPLVAGAAALLMSALPDYTPQQIRKALMMTANQVDTPDNTYGWGIINALDAFTWGVNFYADTTWAYENIEVHFFDSSSIPMTGHKWYFGDGDSAVTANTTHEYTMPGAYDVTLIIETGEGTYTRTKKSYIAVIADTLSLVSDSGYAGNTTVMSIDLSNSQELNEIIVPVSYGSYPVVSLDSVTSGNRTAAFESIEELYRDDATRELLFKLTGSDESPLSFGTGEIARLYFTLDSFALSGESAFVDTAVINDQEVLLSNDKISYSPVVHSGNLTVNTVARGDANDDGTLNLTDILILISYVYLDGPPPVSLESGDIVVDLVINLVDIIELIDIIYR